MIDKCPICASDLIYVKGREKLHCTNNYSDHVFCWYPEDKALNILVDIGNKASLWVTTESQTIEWSRHGALKQLGTQPKSFSSFEEILFYYNLCLESILFL